MDNYAAHRDRSLRGIIDSSKMLLEEGDKQWRFVVEGKASKCGGIYVYYICILYVTVQDKKKSCKPRYACLAQSHCCSGLIRE